MTTSRLISFVLLVLLCASPGKADRMRTSFDTGWKFHLGEVTEGQQPGLDDSTWRDVDLPHDWSIEHPFSPDHASGTGYLPGGIGWYRKTFVVSAADDEVTVEFDGVYRNSDVWINGRHLGHRPYGYSSFHYRLTPHLVRGQENVIAVRVARENVADSRWYTGSGIYRHTWLTRTAPLHIAPWGVFITTPRVFDDQADVHVSIDLRNQSPTPQTVRIVSEILDPDGTTLSVDASAIDAAAGQTATAAHWHVTPNPQRWSPDTPTLYTMVVRVFVEEVCIDEVSTPFGIRSFRFDADHGFFLNGTSTTLRGVCMHHDAGVVGAAVPEPVLERRLRRVKAIGGNAVRCSHNPMAPEFYDLCDRIGLLVMDEAFDEWEVGKRKWEDGRNVGRAKRFGYAEAFDEWGVRDCAAMVRRDRNHPSIILWSIGNEIDYPGDPYVHPRFFDPGAPPPEDGSPRMSRLPVIAPRLIAAVKRHDATRPVTMALSNLPAANAVGVPQLLDVVGYNYQEKFYDDDHRAFPGRVILGSENGRGPRGWRAVTERDFISGQFLWVGFDFLGEAGPWPNHASRAGVFDTRGFRKPIGWLQQALWSDEPVVRLFVLDPPTTRKRGLGVAPHPRRWAGEPGEPMRVAVVSNGESVEVRLNGERVAAGRPSSNGWFEVEVAFEPGTLEATSGPAHDRLVTTGPVKRLAGLVDKPHLTSDGRDVAHVEIRAVDEDGNLVTDADLEVSAGLEGPGRLLGLDHGDTHDPTPLTAPTRRMKDGRLLALVQSTRDPGGLMLSLSAEGLPVCEIRLRSGR